MSHGQNPSLLQFVDNPIAEVELCLILQANVSIARRSSVDQRAEDKGQPEHVSRLLECHQLAQEQDAKSQGKKESLNDHNGPRQLKCSIGIVTG